MMLAEWKALLDIFIINVNGYNLMIQGVNDSAQRAHNNIIFCV